MTDHQNVHFAGPYVTIGGRRRQLCAWCGHVLLDVQLAPGQEHEPWFDVKLVRVEDGTTTRQPYTYGDPLPPGCCALPDDPGEEPASEEADQREHLGEDDVRALRMHLASVHKLANAFELPAADLDDVHQHDHFGPCGLRNHDVADRSYDEVEARAVVAEAEDGPDEAQETRAAADWPAEPIDTPAEGDHV